MNQNELRLGNYVARRYWNPQPNKEGYAVEIGHITFISKSGVNISKIGKNEKFAIKQDFVLPIPLTEKWLIDLGFVLSEFTGLYYGKEVKIYINVTWDNEYTLVFDGIEIREVESVHDLQNLHFALTKEELKINEP